MKDLTQGSAGRQLFFFAIPMILSTLLQSIYQIVDAIWVGRLLGPDPFAAVSVTFPLAFTLMSIFIGLSVATNILIAQGFGAKKFDFLAKVTVNSFLLTVGLAVVFTAGGILLGRQILQLMNTPAPLLDGAYTFLAWFSVGLLFLFLNNWMMGVLRGLGDGTTPLVLTAVSVVLNIALVPLFILGFGPLPPLGIAGSALATVAANLVTAVAGLLYLERKNHLFNIFTWKYELDWSIISKVISLGVPASLQMVIVSLSFVAVMAIVNLFGPDVIGAFGIGVRIDSLAFIPAMAIGMAVSAMVGQSLGAGKPERVKETMRAAILMSTVVCFVLIAVLNLFPRQIAGLFTDKASIIDHTVPYFQIIGVQYWIFSLFFLYMGAVRGAGEMVKPLWIVLGMMALRIPLAWYLGTFTPLKETGVWWAILISTVAGMAGVWAYYKWGGWKDRVVVHRQAPAPVQPAE